MAPHEVVRIIDIMLGYVPRDALPQLIQDLRPVTIDKEYQNILTRLEAEIAKRGSK